MSNPEQMDDLQFMFGAMLVVANKMDTILERALNKYEVTAKQWFLSIALNRLFNAPPTMKELARELGSSHQNIKQVALKLQAKGLLKLEKDKKDARVIRLCLTRRARILGRDFPGLCRLHAGIL